MDRLEKIRAKRQSLDAQEEREKERKANEIENYERKIKELSNRIYELTSIAGELIRNRIPLGKVSYRHGYFPMEELVADGFNHKIGFVLHNENGKKSFRFEIGIEGGGCCGYDFIVDRFGKIIESSFDHIIGLWTYDKAHCDFCRKSDSFLSSFDDFEKRVFAYVDNL